MAGEAYERLGGMDSSFLVFEGPTTHMHVSATLVFDSGPIAKPDGGIDIDQIKAYIASRLHLIPRFRQRLAYVPVENHPVWVDDEHFNIHYHVRHTSLPRPGDDLQLKRLAARIMSQQLDRAKPLWEFWIVEGLQNNRFAIVNKTHHCMIDGLAGVDLLAILMSLEPIDEIEESPAFVPKPAPKGIDLVRSELLRRAYSSFEVVRGLRRALEGGAELGWRVRALGETLGQGLRSAPETPINQPIGPHRRFDYLSMELEDVRAVKNKLGGTVNDVVLATVAGAVRKFLQRRRVEIDPLKFRVLAPVSARSKEQKGVLGNQLSMWLLDLPIAEADPKKRLEKLCQVTGALKESKQALGARTLVQATEWTGSTLLSLASRLLHRARPFNLIVTNVPGPQVPVYLLGAQLESCYPQVPLFPNQALGVALLSYNGRLCWGFNADWDLVPDLPLFADSIVASFNELREVVTPIRVTTRERKRTRRQSRSPEAQV